MSLPLLAEIALSNESLALVSTVIGAVASATVYLWRVDIARIQDQVNDLRAQRDRMFSLIVKNGLGDQLRPGDYPAPTRTPPGGEPGPKAGGPGRTDGG